MILIQISRKTAKSNMFPECFQVGRSLNIVDMVLTRRVKQGGEARVVWMCCLGACPCPVGRGWSVNVLERGQARSAKSKMSHQPGSFSGESPGVKTKTRKLVLLSVLE